MTVERLLDQHADAFGDVDDVAESMQEKFSKRFQQLQNEPQERIPEIWDDGGCPIGVTMDGMDQVPQANRNDEWDKLVQALLACAKEQAWCEVISDPLLRTAEKHARRKEAIRKQMSASQIRQAAKTGPGKARFDSMRQARREKRGASVDR